MKRGQGDSLADLDRLYFQGSTVELAMAVAAFVSGTSPFERGAGGIKTSPFGKGAGGIYSLSMRELYTQVIADVRDGKAGTIHPELYRAYSESLRKAVRSPFAKGGRGDSLSDQFEANLSRFAAYKAFHATRQLERQLADPDGVQRTPEQFDRMARAVLNTFNRYQAAEYNTAVARARTAHQWQQFSQADNMFLFPNLRWLPSRSANPREAHMPFYNRVWAKTDPFWNTNQPGNLWNCKCDWEETDDPVTGDNPEGLKPARGLEGNPAKTGQIFTDQCTYVQKAGKQGRSETEDFFRPIAEHHQKYLTLRDDPNYNEVQFDWGNGGLKATHADHRFETQIGRFGIERGEYEKIARDALFSKGYSVILQKEDPSLGTKQPDGFLNGILMDIKGVEGNPMWAINRACVQGVETCVLYFHDQDAFSESDVRNKFEKELPEWRNNQDSIKDKEMSVKTVVCVINKGGSYDVVKI